MTPMLNPMLLVLVWTGSSLASTMLNSWSAFRMHHHQRRLREFRNFGDIENYCAHTDRRVAKPIKTSEIRKDILLSWKPFVGLGRTCRADAH